MDDPNLLLVCLTAFAAVMLLLVTFAGAIRVMTWLWPGTSTPAAPPPTPGRSGRTDATIVAGISAAASALMPGGRVTRIEEVSESQKSPGKGGNP